MVITRVRKNGPSALSQYLALSKKISNLLLVHTEISLVAANEYILGGGLRTSFVALPEVARILASPNSFLLK